jgi:dynein heavy chain
VRKKLTQWEFDLNRVFDVIQAWLDVQRKWIYLLSIFSSEDIRLALPEENKKFNKTDTNYKKIMESVYKSPNVLQCCVRGESSNRLDELQNISRELDKCQKSLVTYLEDKRTFFARFYFISDEILLEILGTSNPEAIQPHLLKLFDNCAKLTFGQGGKVITAMVSEEKEEYDFITPVKPDDKIESWMSKVEEEMRRTLHFLTKKAVFEYAKEDRLEWL